MGDNDSRQLEDEFLGEDKRIRPDPVAVKEAFRRWFEPIIVAVILMLIGALIYFASILGEFGARLDAMEAAQADNAESVIENRSVQCRILIALDVEIYEGGPCTDNGVQTMYTPEQGQSGWRAETTEMLCLIADAVEVPFRDVRGLCG